MQREDLCYVTKLRQSSTGKGRFMGLSDETFNTFRFLRQYLLKKECADDKLHYIMKYSINVSRFPYIFVFGICFNMKCFDKNRSQQFIIRHNSLILRIL